MKKVTIKDVALKAGVSISTISNALNPNSKKISDTRRSEILNIVQEMDYIPDPNAKKIASKNNKNVGLFVRNYGVHNVEDTISAQIIYYMNYYSNVYDMDMVNIYSTKDNEDFGKLILNKVRAFNFTDIVIFGIDKNDVVIHEIEKINVNKIYIDAPISSKNSYFVATDNYKAQRELLHYTYNQNKFEAMYYLTGDLNSFVGVERLHATESFCRKKAIKLILLKGEFSIQSGFDLISGIDNLENYPIFCGSDTIAIGVTKYLKKFNKNNLVIGFDGLEMMEYITSNFITIKQNFKMMCEQAVKMIFTNQYEVFISEFQILDLRDKTKTCNKLIK